jgi:hypothetical protein
MAEQYKQLIEQNPNFKVENLVLPPSIGAPDADSPGQKILTAAVTKAGGRSSVTFQHVWEEFRTNDLRTGWEWRPSGSGHSANLYGILDGTKLFGECRHFANALCLLVRAPWPFGLGLPHSETHVDLYEGDINAKGFISPHDGTFLRLTKNIAPSPANNDDLYLWENHKTVFYQEVYYDVCYRTTYTSRRFMASYQLPGVEITVPAASPTNTFYAEKARRTDGRYSWFKRITPSDNIATPGRAYVGPIDETSFERLHAAAKNVTPEKHMEQQLKAQKAIKGI